MDHLNSDNMYTYTLGGKDGRKFILRESDNLVAVRTKNSRDLQNAVITDKGKKVLKDFEVLMEFPEADITVFQTKESVKDDVTVRNKARSALKKGAGT